ncbi:MAG TPA: site-specific DNA-methyltransferase, partial [Verrucomicrobiae bacterium]|nr:site-specific DNA-methyltransferase [Verrucomicrobiae bacterium]
MLRHNSPAKQKMNFSIAHNGRKTKRVVKNGQATTELVLSASLDGNDSIFPKILELYIRRGSVVADITYGKGVFWRNVPPGNYKLLATDI